MPADHQPTHDLRAPLPGRRALLLALTGIPVATLAACHATSNGAGGGSNSTSAGMPTPHQTGGGSASGGAIPPAPTASGTEPWGAEAHELSTSANLFAGAAAPNLKGTTPAFRTWATACATMCAQQAAVLALPDPLSGTGVSPARPVATRLASMDAAVKAIATRQASRAADLTARAQLAGDGDQTLLLIALATAAHATAAPGPAPTQTALRPGHGDVGNRLDALQVLLDRVETAAQGYETGAGHFAADDARLAAAQQRINALWALRDTVQSQITGASATPSPEPLIHPMPGTFASVAAIQQTWARLEMGLCAAWGRVAAASTGVDRSGAIKQVLAQADIAQGLGLGVSTWPAWT